MRARFLDELQAEVAQEDREASTQELELEQLRLRYPAGLSRSCSSYPSQTFPNLIRSAIFATATGFVKDSVALAHAPMDCRDAVQAREAGGENIRPAFWSIRENLVRCHVEQRA